VTLLDRIKTTGLLFDGAIGTELQRKGLPFGTPPDLWNLENPDAVREMHAAYVDAGSDVVVTNTFNANPVRFAEYKSDQSWEAVTRRGVELAKQAVSGRALVAGEIGPSGLLLEPVGPGKPADIERSFAAQAKLIEDEGVDLFIAETFFSLQEILLVARAFRSVSPRPFILSMTFEKKRRGYFTIMGDRIDRALQALADTGAIAVGANCTLGSADMIELAAQARQAVSIPMIIQPNAGQPQVTPEGTIYNEDPESFAANIARIRELGVEIVGGCCGTQPATIGAIRARWT